MNQEQVEIAEMEQAIAHFSRNRSKDRLTVVVPAYVALMAEAMMRARVETLKAPKRSEERLILDLAMLVRRLAYFVGKYAPAGMKCKNQAVEFLTLNGLQGSVLRDEYTDGSEKSEASTAAKAK